MRTGLAAGVLFEELIAVHHLPRRLYCITGNVPPVLYLTRSASHLPTLP
jgi:hypothetical protein